ncbi:MAG: peptidoglycan DD-metalloendopeptidase family protein [Gammaproteobacteria bacterium]|nr:peptidoglycan DD-metalloendopeptidase family protein [Gammaproteobacteria bacterium]
MSLLLAISVMAGCGGSTAVAPVDSFDEPAATRRSTHTVKRGETLYSIAWQYGLDYRTLAARNGVREPFTIYPGQRLRIDGGVTDVTKSDAGAPTESRVAVVEEPRGQAWKPLESEDKEKRTQARKKVQKPAPAAPKTATKPATTRKKSTRKPVSGENVSGWGWPTEGRIITTFSKSGGKGVDISGRLGQSVVAAADGRVVYAGGGLRGYGELIIVKHNKRFLSAYAHNNRILVKEGDTVKVGQRIAEMGSTGTDRVKLHFEIRRDGKPVDPVRYLPKS